MQSKDLVGTKTRRRDARAGGTGLGEVGNALTAFEVVENSEFRKNPKGVGGYITFSDISYS